MRFQALFYFIQVANIGSISQAAEQLYITQQGLSRILSSLSHELGVPLFIRKRDGSGISLTPQGQKVLTYAKEVHQSYSEFIETLHQDSHGQRKSGKSLFTLYASPLFCISILPQILCALQIQMPQIGFHVQEYSPLRLLNETELASDSLCLVNIPDFELKKSERLQRHEIYFSEFYDEPIWLQVPQNFLQYTSKLITKEELKSIPLAIFKANHYDHHELLEHIAGGNLDILKPLVHSSNQQICQQLIKSGQACSFGSAFYQYYFPIDNTVLVPLEDAVTVRYGVITKEKPGKQSIESEVLRIMDMEFKKIKKYSKVGSNQ